MKTHQITLLLMIIGIAIAQTNSSSLNITTTQSTISSEDSGTRVLTVGYGTFTIILSIIIQLLLTFFCGRSSRFPELIFLFTLIIPIVVSIFFVYAPKEAERQIIESSQFSSNPWLILQVFAIIIAVISIIITGIMLLALVFFRGTKAIRISSQLEMERDKQKIIRMRKKEKEGEEGGQAEAYQKINTNHQNQISDYNAPF